MVKQKKLKDIYNECRYKGNTHFYMNEGLHSITDADSYANLLEDKRRKGNKFGLCLNKANMYENGEDKK